MKTIAFTGGSGFIGRYICEAIEKSAAEYKLKNLDLENPQFDFHGETFRGDLRDREACRKLVEGSEVVVNLAAAHKDFGIERDEYFDVNENGTRVLLEAMDDADIKKLIFTSSVAVYNPDLDQIDESTVPDPQNPYGASKLAAEAVIEKWVEQGEGRSALIIRPTVVIGPRNRATMYALIDQISRGKYLFNIGAGQNVKSLAIAQNLADFVVAMADKSEWPAGTVVTNFVDAPQMRTSETIKIIHEELGKSLPKITIPLNVVAWMALPFDWLAKCIGRHSPITPARVRKLGKQTQFESKVLPGLGYEPKVSTADGLREMVGWYKSL